VKRSRRILAAGLLLAGAALARVPAVVLESDQGPVALNALPGQVQIVAVGYTHCPDVCPTTLARMKLMLRELGPHAQRVQAVFVSVDYVRDTPATVDAYAKHFSPQILGLAGEKKAIERLIDVYPVNMEMTATPGESGFLVDHSAHFLVLRHGEVVAILPSSLSPEVLAELIIDQLAGIGIGSR
jgi:protein SCO1/2